MGNSSKIEPVENDGTVDTLSQSVIVINDTAGRVISKNLKSVLDVLKYYKIKIPVYYYSRLEKTEIEPGGYYNSFELFSKEKHKLFFCSFNRNITPTTIVYYENGGADSTEYLFNASERKLIKLD
jgi:hypothetical protein